MADYEAKVAPFINVVFYVTATAGRYPSGGYHSGLDISTGTGTKGKNLYSICDGVIVEKSYQANGYGNYVVIKDNNSNYAFLFGHMYEPAIQNIGDSIKLGEQFGIEGATGNVTGLHTHVEMQDYVKNDNKWVHGGQDPSLWGDVYLPPTDYMGFPNINGISVYYNGVPIQPTPTPITKNKKKFNWVLYAKRIRNKKLLS